MHIHTRIFRYTVHSTNTPGRRIPLMNDIFRVMRCRCRSSSSQFANTPHHQCQKRSSCCYPHCLTLECIMPSHAGAVVPFADSWWSFLLKPQGANHRSMDRALGAAAAMGLSIVVLRLVAQAFKSAKQNGQESDTFQILQDILKRLFVTRQQEQEPVHDSASTETVLHLHSGSCHCRAVTFEVSMTEKETLFLLKRQ